MKAASIRDEAVVAKAIETYRRLYAGISLRTVCLFPHVKEVLQTLHRHGVTLTVASSKGKEALVELLERLEVAPYVSCVFGEQDVKNKKPAPDMALHILERTNTLAQEALVVGDTVFDIAMGQSAGCLTCGVTYGNHTADQLRRQGADYIVDDFFEILDIAVGNGNGISGKEN